MVTQKVSTIVKQSASQLYTYFRSSAAYRVRIALNLKDVQADNIPVHLLKDGGQQHADGYRDKNPQGLVPMLVEDEQAITQSLAIIEYLDEMYPQPRLLPVAHKDRAQVRALALQVACEIHPLNNLRVLQYLTAKLKVTEEQKLEWIQHWIELGFSALEQQVQTTSTDGQFCFGAAVSLADCVLIPQMYNAQRFDVSLSQFPTLASINEHCLALDEFASAAPERQPDAPR